jgi:cytochrome b561
MVSAKKRFRPLWVSLHWLMAFLVFFTFGIGLLSLANTPNTSAKFLPLGVHMAVGIAILLIVVVRYGMRVLIYKPQKRIATSPSALSKTKPFLDQLSVYVHPLLYLVTALMAALGIAIAFPANLFAAVFARSGAALPANFYEFPARAWHGTLSLGLMLLIVQHVLVAVFHQFIKGENFLGRMWFTKD